MQNINKDPINHDDILMDIWKKLGIIIFILLMIIMFSVSAMAKEDTNRTEGNISDVITCHYKDKDHPTDEELTRCLEKHYELFTPCFWENAHRIRSK